MLRERETADIPAVKVNLGGGGPAGRYRYLFLGSSLFRACQYRSLHRPFPHGSLSAGLAADAPLCGRASTDEPAAGWRCAGSDHLPGRQTPPATVPQVVMVQGTSRNLRPGQKIWGVHPEPRRHPPQPPAPGRGPQPPTAAGARRRSSAAPATPASASRSWSPSQTPQPRQRSLTTWPTPTRRATTPASPTSRPERADTARFL